MTTRRCIATTTGSWNPGIIIWVTIPRWRAGGRPGGFRLLFRFGIGIRSWCQVTVGKDLVLRDLAPILLQDAVDRLDQLIIRMKQWRLHVVEHWVVGKLFVDILGLLSWLSIRRWLVTLVVILALFILVITELERVPDKISRWGNGSRILVLSRAVNKLVNCLHQSINEELRWQIPPRRAVANRDWTIRAISRSRIGVNVRFVANARALIIVSDGNGGVCTISRFKKLFSSVVIGVVEVLTLHERAVGPKWISHRTNAWE
ncbi:hypothetical protein QBC44DRAFT_94337 [Cladorrhinum sp. PSN332]|nr:hypothetical protein QBC44DRAFT_94337 [Cladorrhinum sp. PSN332]